MIRFAPCIQSIGLLALSSPVFNPGVVHSPKGDSWPIEQLHQTYAPHSTRFTNLPPVFIDFCMLDFVKKGTQLMNHCLCRALFGLHCFEAYCVMVCARTHSFLKLNTVSLFDYAIFKKKSVLQRRHIWDIYALWLLSTVFLWTFYPQILETLCHGFQLPHHGLHLALLIAQASVL